MRFFLVIWEKVGGKKEVIDENNLGCPGNSNNPYPHFMTSETSWNPTALW